MLDFYLIPDDVIKSNFPGQKGLKLIGGLDDRTFEGLKNKKIIPDRFDYYSDFRWDTALIKQLHDNIRQRQLQSDTDVKQLLLLLDIAEKNQSGLTAYGD